MQASVAASATSEPFFQQTIGGRPFGLWCIWLMGTFGWLFIFVGLILDEVGYSTYFVVGDANNDANDEQQCTCGYASFNCLGSGFQDQQYEDFDDEAIFLQQIQAGNGWLGLMIMAMIFSISCCYGFGKDYLEGEYDSSKPSDYWDGCPGPCQPCGFSTYGIIMIIIWSILALIWWAAGEQCSNIEFWEVFQNGLEDFTALGGLTVVLVILAIILFVGILGLVFYMNRTFGYVPRGDRKSTIFKFQAKAIGDVPEQKPKPKPAPAAAPTGKPPPSSIFNPSNNVTSNPKSVDSKPSSNNGNNNNTNETNPWKQKANMNSKPKGPPPKPSKPKGPPPVPK